MRRSAVALAAMLLMAGPLEAQILIPGAHHPDRNTMRAQYLDAVLQGIRATDAKWLTAWEEDDAASCARLYAEDAFIVTLEGDRVSGRDAIAAYLAALLPRSGSLLTSLVELDGSNWMAMTLQNFMLPPSAAGNPTLQGMLFTVYKSDGRVWLIRSQLFRPVQADAS